MKKIMFAGLVAGISAFMFAGCGAAAAPSDAGTASAVPTLVMMIAIFAVFYFMMIRPENKRKKKAEEMRNSIQVGDKITTIGGMVGRVVHVTDDRITFESGEDRVRIEVTKWAISSNDGKGANKEKSDSEETLGA